AAETAASGVTVNAVCPGYTDTDLVRESATRVAAKTGRTEADVLAEYRRDAPIGRLIRPEEVAAAVLYLCSPEAAAVTGTTLALAQGSPRAARESDCRGTPFLPRDGARERRLDRRHARGSVQ